MPPPLASITAFLGFAFFGVFALVLFVLIGRAVSKGRRRGGGPSSMHDVSAGPLWSWPFWTGGHATGSDFSQTHAPAPAGNTPHASGHAVDSSSHASPAPDVSSSGFDSCSTSGDSGGGCGGGGGSD